MKGSLPATLRLSGSFAIVTLFYLGVQSLPLPSVHNDRTTGFRGGDAIYIIFLILAYGPPSGQPYAILNVMSGTFCKSALPLLWVPATVALPLVFALTATHVPVVTLALAGFTWMFILNVTLYYKASSQTPGGLRKYRNSFFLAILLIASYFFLGFVFIFVFARVATEPHFQILCVTLYQVVTHFLYKILGINFIMAYLEKQAPETNTAAVRCSILIFFAFLAKLFITFTFPDITSPWVLVYAIITEGMWYALPLRHVVFHADEEPEPSTRCSVRSNPSCSYRLEAGTAAPPLKTSSGASKAPASSIPLSNSRVGLLDAVPGSSASSGSSLDDGGEEMTSSEDSSGLDDDAVTGEVELPGHVPDGAGRPETAAVAPPVTGAALARAQSEFMASLSKIDINTNSTIDLQKQLAENQRSHSVRIDESPKGADINTEAAVTPKAVRAMSTARSSGAGSHRIRASSIYHTETAPDSLQTASLAFFCQLVFQTFAVVGAFLFYFNFCHGVNADFFRVASQCSVENMGRFFGFAAASVLVQLVLFLIISRYISRKYNLSVPAIGLEYLDMQSPLVITTLCAGNVLATLFFIAHIDAYDYLVAVS